MSAELRGLEITLDAMVKEYQEGTTRKDDGLIEYSVSAGCVGIAIQIVRHRERMTSMMDRMVLGMGGLAVLLALILWRVW